MPFHTQRKLGFAALLSAFLLSFSCSTGPKAPEKGTPAFFWQAATETYRAGDYTKTLEHLDHLINDQNEYTARALPWSMVITSGMAAGYMEIAEDYAIGARTNKSDPSGFRRTVTDSRGAANRLALQFAETFAKLQKSKDDPIPLAFGFPIGTATQVGQMNKVTNGIALSPQDAEMVQKRMIERAVILALCRAVGNPDDPAKTAEFMKTPDAKVPRATFLLAMTQALYDESQLYTSTKLDQPQKMEILCQRAQEAAKSLPESKETKELSAKIDKALKKKKT